MKKEESSRITFTGNVTVHGPMFDIHDNGQVTIMSTKEMAEGTTELSKEVLGRAIKEVEKLMWGQSSYAVIYCVLRDKFGYGDNATSFENDIMTFSSRLGLQYACPPTTISSAIYNNPYLKLHVDKWQKRGVKPRSLLLAEAFIQAIEDLQNG